MKKYLDHIGKKSKKAVLKSVNTKKKNKVLLDFAILIKKNEKNIIKQNKKDISFAIKKGLKKNMIERLILDKIKIKQIENSIKKIVNLKDPVDKIIEKWKRPNGLRFKKVTIPIGVIGIIYESRPNVTSDVSCLCFKSGNAVILKGGSEAFYSNKILPPCDTFLPSFLPMHLPRFPTTHLLPPFDHMRQSPQLLLGPSFRPDPIMPLLRCIC